MIATYSIHRRGYGHKKNELPCQDYSTCYFDKRIAIASVSDGHSDPKCYRSEYGAKFACESIVNILKDIALTFPNFDAIRVISDDSIRGYKEKFFGEWVLSCKKHLLNNPVSEDELNVSVSRYVKRQADKRPVTAIDDYRAPADSLSDVYVRFQETILNNSTRLYGTTCQAVLLTDTYILVCQNGLKGMGAIAYIDGTTEQRLFSPLDMDEPLSGSTDSLCDKNALEKVQVQVFPINISKPFAIFVMCDGVSESYEKSQFFHALDYFAKQVKLEEPERTKFFNKRLDYLSEASADEDDVSLAIIVNNLDEYCDKVNADDLQTCDDIPDSLDNVNESEHFDGLSALDLEKEFDDDDV